MKKVLFGFTAGLLIGVSGAASAATTATVSGTATIVSPVSITKNDDLAFGTIIKPSTGTTTVTLSNSADSVTLAGGTGAGKAGSPKRAKLTVTGDGGQSFTLNVHALELSSGTDTLTVALSPDQTGTIAFGGTAGTDTDKVVYIGGNFDITSTTVAGAYTGTFDVDVQYQ